LIALLFAGCGKGIVEVTNESYEPRIVIEGILQAHSGVDNIRVARNFPLDMNLRENSILPDPQKTTVLITDLKTGKNYELIFHIPADNNFDDYYWRYLGDDLIIQPGQSYAIDVETVIDGETLTAHAETTVPREGLEIERVTPQSMTYREKDQAGNTRNFEVYIQRSPDTDFYIMSVKSLVATTDNFIYDNSFADLKPEDVEDDLDDFAYDYLWLQDTPLDSGTSLMEIYWFNLWFYSEYQVIVYAADENYREFLMTYNDVQEDDGNFHEPIFNIEGDGIGVFGSVIADTAYISVVNN
jgi:hypothetical protein